MVSKTVELRKVITTLLKQVKHINNQVYFENASSTAAYPYIVYNINSIDLNSYPRNDVVLTVDVWDNNSNTSIIEDVADDVEAKLNMVNYPTATVLPTFYLNIRNSIIDEDKTIKRRQLKFIIQNYERSV